MQTVKASCLCGKSSYDLSFAKGSLPLATNVCHCGICRRISGVLCVTYAKTPEGTKLPDMTLLRGYKTSNRLTRYFCATCGTHMLVHVEGTEMWATATGTLAKADGIIKLVQHTHLEDTKDGGFSDWLPKMGDRTLTRCKGAPGTENIELGWRDKSVPSSITPTGRLHAHCQCNGVSFFIQKASPKSAETQGPYPDALLPYFVEDRPPPTEPWWLRDNQRKFLASNCTCDSCRLATGFEFQQWAFVPTADISLSADGSVPFAREFGTLQAYRSRDDVTRRFCGTCGATVFWDGDVRPGLIDVSVGMLDAEEGVRAETWLEWSTSRLSYREDSIKRAKEITEAVEAGLEKSSKHTGSD